MRNITFINVPDAYITRNGQKVRIFGEVVPSVDGLYQVMGEVRANDSVLTVAKTAADEVFEEAYTYDVVPGSKKNLHNIIVKGSMYITPEELDTLRVGF